jgi:act minimal PKS acyl carrier protein
MDEFTYDDLQRVLTESAGEIGVTGLGRGNRDVSLGDLGYDSLAVLDAVGRLSRQYGVSIDDDDLTITTTPGRAVHYINSRLSAEM